MFDIGWSELLLIGIVALIAIGPKELPGALRALGQWMGKIRRMAGEFQNQFHEAMREAELADLKKEVDEMTAKAESYAAQFDPIGDIRRDLETAASPPPELETPLTETPPPAEALPGETPAPVDTAALPPPETADAPVHDVATHTDSAAPAPPPDAPPTPAGPAKPDTGRAA